MKLRLGVPIVAALVGLLGFTPAASASHVGAGNFSSCCNPCDDAQGVFSSAWRLFKPRYQLVFDTVLEKRWHTTYQTVNETVLKDVKKTCYREETRTCYKPCTETVCKTVQETVMKPVYSTNYRNCEFTITKPVTRTVCKEVEETKFKPVYETAYKECKYTTCKKVPVQCERECSYTVCKPVCEVENRTVCGQICKNICEDHVKECVSYVCKPVCETTMKECAYTVRKHVVEECMKEVRCTEWRTEVQHCEREVTRTVKKPVTEMRTISKLVGEWCTEEYTVPGRKMVKWVREQECEFDPCTCKCVCKPGKWTKCETQCPDQVCSRRVYRTRTICCEVPVTKNVKECIVEKVPYTVCKKVPVTVCKQVPVKVSKVVCETCTKQVPVTTTRMVSEKVVKSVPYTTRRVAHGAYVDSKDGMGYADPGEGRSFVEGAKYQKVVTTTRLTQCTRTFRKPARRWFPTRPAAWFLAPRRRQYHAR
ncbi:MAG: hypothetical protein NTZ71_08945 [Planctomycetota bacterium]|nr:hypothetical protein [Planctomycetota bacterium]